MKSYYEMQKSLNQPIASELDIKVDAEAVEIKKNSFTECGCIPRSLRETVIDQRVLELIASSGKTEVTLLSLGSGNLGQEYHINKLLTENGIHVQWLLVDKIYNADDESCKLLRSFQEVVEETGSSVLGAYSDISGYAAFKLGKTGFSHLQKSSPALFTKTWTDLFTDHPLNSVIFKRKHGEFSSRPLPDVDLILALDMNPTGMSGYEKTKELTQDSLSAALLLDPKAACLSVINKRSMGARTEMDLDIDATQPTLKSSFGFY